MSTNKTEQSLRKRFQEWGDAGSKEDKKYAETGSKLAYDIQVYMQENEILSTKTDERQHAESMLSLIDGLTGATTCPIHIRQGIKMENMLTAIIEQADKLTAKLESKKGAHLTTNHARELYEEAIEKIKSIRQKTLLYQTAHHKAKKGGECWIPISGNSDCSQFKSLAKEIEHLQTFVESNTKTFEHGWFGNLLEGLNKLLEVVGFSTQKSASMRKQIQNLKGDIDNLDPSNKSNQFDV